MLVFVCQIFGKIYTNNEHLVINSIYRKRLNCSPSIFHACTSDISEVHAWKNDGLLFKRLVLFTFPKERKVVDS